MGGDSIIEHSPENHQCKAVRLLRINDSESTSEL